MKLAYMRGLHAICCFLFLLPCVSAQTVDTAVAENADEQYPRSIIRVASTLVSVPVSVADASGQKISDLKVENFRLAEDGRQAEIFRLVVDNSRLNIALLFDVSGSVNHNFEFEQNAAIDFLKKVWKDGDTVSIISFDDHPDVLLKSSDNLQEAMWTLRQVRPTGKTTAFFDAVTLASKILEQSASEGTRQALIVISDGANNMGGGSLASTLSEMQRRDAVFYAINPTNAAIVRLNLVIKKGQENLTTLADATGGAVFISDEPRDLDGIFNKIMIELRAQYLLLYYSLIREMDGKFHTIEVSVPGRPELSVRARTGFLAVTRN